MFFVKSFCVGDFSRRFIFVGVDLVLFGEESLTSEESGDDTVGWVSLMSAEESSDLTHFDALFLMRYKKNYAYAKI